MQSNSRRAAIAGTTLVLASVLAIGLPLFEPWRLFTDKVVDESLPGVTDTALSSESPTTRSSSGPMTLAHGTFTSHEHHATGSAAILRLADGSRLLRIEELDTSDGPDLKVWLTDAPVIEGGSGWHVFDDGRYVDLGDLKGNKGNQNYAIPSDLDLSAYRSVSIWCDRFNVSFGAAALTGP